MRWIDSCNHNIFSICLSCLREHNFFLNEKEWLILQKKTSLFYEVQIEFFFLCYEIDHGSIPFLFGSIEYTHNSELHVTPPKRHVRARASPLD